MSAPVSARAHPVTVLSAGRGPAGLRGAEETWERLAAGSDSFMQQLIWARACAHTTPDREVRVVAAGDGALAPLIRRWSGPSSWEVLGPAELREPAELLWSDPAALDALCEWLARSGVVLFFERIEIGSPTYTAIRRAYGRRGIVLAAPKPASPYVSLVPLPPSPEAVLDARQRKLLRNARNRASRMGGLRFELLSPGPAELPPLFDELCRIEASGWKGRAGSAIATDPRRSRLWGHYAVSAAETGVVRFGVLRIGERVACVEMAAEVGRRLWALKFGFDEALGFCSPGQLLTGEMLRHAIERRLESYELLGNHEGYKVRWTRAARPCVLLIAGPRSPGGLAAVAADLAYIALRRTRFLITGNW